MTSRLSVLLMAMLLLSSPAAAAPPGPSQIRLDFENAAAGTLPAGFETGLTGKGGAVKWMALEDPSAPAGPNVLAETSGDATSDRFPLAILQGFEAQDVE